MKALLPVTAVAALLALAAAQAGPNDPHYPQQWGLQRIEAPTAWQESHGDGIVVAVIDSGVDLGHPDLAGAFARRADGQVLGYDFVDDDADPTDEHGHGTMVAGIVAARTSNGQGVASVAPRARIMPIRVLDATAGGTSDDVDEAIRWAVDNGAHVINLSLEIAREEGPTTVVGSRAPDDAVRYAWDRGVAVVAAAGNDSDEFTDYRRDAPVLLVGATDREDQPADFSDSGRDDAVMAPGVDIVSTWCNPCGRDARHVIGQSEGTSYAAPHVAGTIALLRATGMSAADAVARVRGTAKDVGEPGRDARTGYGRIDAAAAVGASRAEPTTSPSASPPASPSPSPTSPTRTAAAPDTPTAPPPPSAPAVPSQVPSTVAPSSPAPTVVTSTTPPATTSPPAAAPPQQATGRTVGPWAIAAGVLLAADLALLAVATSKSRRTGRTP